MPRTRGSNARATALIGVAALGVATLARSARTTIGPRALAGVRRSLGAAAGAGADRSHASSHFVDGAFQNSEPFRVVDAGGRRSIALEFATKGRIGLASGEIPLATPVWPETAAACAATWLGHSTVLLEVGGRYVLTDPVWSDRVSPSANIGPRRQHPVPVDIETLPRLDAVLISHDHYDHLDTATIDLLVHTQTMPFVVPLGVGDHLRSWGVPEERIVELDWSEAVDLAGLRLTCAEARHFSGRLFTQNTTLWAAWLVEADERSAFFGGDSGYTSAFAEVGRRHGPVDLTVLPIGAYDDRWPDVHMTPAEAIRSHLDLRGGLMLPIHWGTFDLAFHTWAAPADWARTDAAEHGVRLAQPRPGERFDATRDLPTEQWWTGL